MYILQIADLHIGSATRASRNEKEIVYAGIRQIYKIVPQGEDILICICGDLIDSKELNDNQEVVERYREAGEILDLINKELGKAYTVTMKFCLGNHDITHRTEFYQCVNRFDLSVEKNKLEGSYSYQNREGAYFIFVNSCDTADYSKGVIDYQKLKQVLKSLPEEKEKILVLHHTVMSMDSEDSSSIRNAAELIKIINHNNIIGVLHGHNHGRNVVMVGDNQCKLIGVGALFSRENPDVNSQFNVINYTKGVFREIQSCLFMADTGNDGEWSVINIGGINCENYFNGKRFSLLYNQLMNKLHAVSPLHNVVLQINSTYEEFLKDLDKFFENDTLKIGEKSYSYYRLAEMWEETEVPDELYFNHGEYFKVGEEHGIRLIAKRLKDIPTSNRTVLATYDMNTILETLKDQTNLPSLSSVQFSKDNDDGLLYIHMHLRALEAGRFLKININEIRWMLEQLKKEEVSFSRINIVISAFRVQIKDKFNCFIKAHIDAIEPEELAMLVYEKEVDEICQLLREKRDASETITHSEGMRSLMKALNAINNRKGSISYSEVITEKLDEIIQIYDTLDEIHKKRSIQSDEEKENEKKLEKELDQIIEVFDSMKEIGKDN